MGLSGFLFNIQIVEIYSQKNYFFANFWTTIIKSVGIVRNYIITGSVVTAAIIT